MGWPGLAGRRGSSCRLRGDLSRSFGSNIFPLRHVSNDIRHEESTSGAVTDQPAAKAQHSLLQEGYRSTGSRAGQETARGVSIDKKGRLNVTCAVKAKKHSRTALILSAASPSLTEADFTRLLEEHRSTVESGFEAAIPGRDPATLDRLPYWILLFTSPFLAAAYQNRLIWYHQNAVDHQPVNPLQAALTPGRGLIPPPGYIDPHSGENLWKRIQEYTLLQPGQRLDIAAVLPAFPDAIAQAIHRHQTWNKTSQDRSCATRLRIPGLHLSADQLAAFLHDDSRIQGKPWGLLHHRSSDMPSQGSCSDGSTPRIIVEECAHLKSRDFILNFNSQSESLRFWRTWHLRPFPTGTGDQSVWGPFAPLLHVELIH